MKNYYEILGFDKIVKLSEISNRHVYLTENFINNRHNGDLSTQEFEEQTEAFYLLNNPKLKVIYDQFCKINFENKRIRKQAKSKKYESKIDEGIIEAREKAKELAQLTNAELKDRNKQINKRSWLTPIRNIFAFILDFFLTFN